MAYLFFYGSLLAAGIVFMWRLKGVGLNDKLLTVGIAGIGWSLVFDFFFGSSRHLYYYITSENSMFYMLVSGIFLYPLLDVLYAMHLPDVVKHRIIYTAVWLAAMIIFEYASLRAGTIVFTGWRLFPWSYVTYLVTFLWIIAINDKMDNKLKVKRNP